MDKPLSMLEAAKLLGNKFLDVLFLPSSGFSVYVLAFSCLLGAGLLACARRGSRKIPGFKTIWRALISKRVWRSPSFQTDLVFFILNSLFFPILLGFLVFSGDAIAAHVHATLDAVFGARAEWSASVSMKVMVTLILFLAWDFGYWLAHYLNHRIEFLWELHKVHHTAEVITPFTNWRVHPLYAVFLLNMLALSVGTMIGLLDWFFGVRMPQFELLGANILLVLYIWSIYHLQHSEFWIPLSGVAGHIFISPAHHQLHHSRDPKHFDKNFGGCLAIWDAMFHTLELPAEKNPHLSFGLDGGAREVHGAFEMLVAPVLRAARVIRRQTGDAVEGFQKAPRPHQAEGSRSGN